MKDCLDQAGVCVCIAVGRGWSRWPRWTREDAVCSWVVTFPSLDLALDCMEEREFAEQGTHASPSLLLTREPASPPTLHDGR